MQYPDFPTELRNPLIFQGMVEEIADRERDWRTNHPQWVDEISVRIGARCLRIVDGGGDSDNDFAGQVNLSARQRGIYEKVDKMAIYAYDPMRAYEYQQDMHESVVMALCEVREASAAKSGLRSELTILALLTRYAHPDMLAYPALQHHDLDIDAGGHFDVGTIIREPDGEITPYRLQIKSH